MGTVMARIVRLMGAFQGAIPKLTKGIQIRVSLDEDKMPGT